MERSPPPHSSMAFPWPPEPWAPDDVGTRSIVTLGDPGTAVTCSMDAAQSLYPRADLIGVSSFEEACR